MPLYGLPMRSGAILVCGDESHSFDQAGEVFVAAANQQGQHDLEA
jgi:hypothetical protein